jgi:hypothetical protein
MTPQAVISQLLLPMFFALIALVIAKTGIKPTNAEIRPLYDLVHNYGKSTVLYTTFQNSTLTSNDLSLALGDALVNFMAQSGPKQSVLEVRSHTFVLTPLTSSGPAAP